MRRTYHYDPVVGGLVPGPSEQRGKLRMVSDRLYSDAPFKAHDGTLIHSRKSHREYMKRNNLTTVDDFKGTWDAAAKERADWCTTGKDPTRKKDILDAIAKLDPG